MAADAAPNVEGAHSEDQEVGLSISEMTFDATLDATLDVRCDHEGMPMSVIATNVWLQSEQQIGMACCLQPEGCPCFPSTGKAASFAFAKSIRACMKSRGCMLMSLGVIGLVLAWLASTQKYHSMYQMAQIILIALLAVSLISNFLNANQAAAIFCAVAFLDDLCFFTGMKGDQEEILLGFIHATPRLAFIVLGSAFTVVTWSLDTRITLAASALKLCTTWLALQTFVETAELRLRTNQRVLENASMVMASYVITAVILAATLACRHREKLSPALPFPPPPSPPCTPPASHQTREYVTESQVLFRPVYTATAQALAAPSWAAARSMIAVQLDAAFGPANAAARARYELKVEELFALRHMATESEPEMVFEKLESIMQGMARDADIPVELIVSLTGVTANSFRRFVVYKIIQGGFSMSASEVPLLLDRYRWSHGSDRDHVELLMKGILRALAEYRSRLTDMHATAELRAEARPRLQEAMRRLMAQHRPKVRVKGVVSRRELNGQLGTVLGNQGAERVQVRLDSGVEIALKPANLENVADDATYLPAPMLEALRREVEKRASSLIEEAAAERSERTQVWLEDSIAATAKAPSSVTETAVRELREQMKQASLNPTARDAASEATKTRTDDNRSFTSNSDSCSTSLNDSFTLSSSSDRDLTSIDAAAVADSVLEAGNHAQELYD